MPAPDPPIQAVDGADRTSAYRGKARIVRPGSELTLLTYSAMVHRAVEAVDRLGLDVEIIDLRSLDRASLDWETIEASIRKTNNVLIVEQGPIGTSYGTSSPTRFSAA